MKKILILAAPLLLFLVLALPYDYLNQTVIVDWLGCGCPRVDPATGEIFESFNANDFTACFWLLISLCTAALSAVLAKKRMAEKKLRLKIGYVALMFGISLMIASQLTQYMMWD